MVIFTRSFPGVMQLRYICISENRGAEDVPALLLASSSPILLEPGSLDNQTIRKTVNVPLSIWLHIFCTADIASIPSLLQKITMCEMCKSVANICDAGNRNVYIIELLIMLETASCARPLRAHAFDIDR